MSPFFIWLFFFHLVISSPFPDNSDRDASHLAEMDSLNPEAGHAYYVYPLDPDNAVELSQTETFLQSLADQAVQENLEDGKLLSWTVSLRDDASIEKIKDRQSIRTFEPQKSLTNERSARKRQDEEKTWIVHAADPYNADEVKSTREWLESIVEDKASVDEIRAPPKSMKKEDRKNTGIAAWGGFSLNDTALEDVKKHPGVAAVTENTKLVEFGSMSGVAARMREDLAKRAVVQWLKQESAPDYLAMVSEYKGGPFDTTDFVYEKDAGKDVNIYVIDRGVNVRVKNKKDEDEFSHWKLDDILQTDQSSARGEGKDIDDSVKSHGTAVASKALGKLYGVAKEANLIPVKISSDLRDLHKGFVRVWEDLERRYEGPDPDNEQEIDQKAVVLCSLGGGDIYTPEQARAHPDGKLFINVLTYISNYGVPIVLASGNGALDGRPIIDSIPQVLEGGKDLEGGDIPVINVGATTSTGTLWAGTQRGDQLTIYAPGENIQFQSKVDKEELTDSGTSLAAPIVAGVIATLMNHDPLPWTQPEWDKGRVDEIKKHIQTPAASWERAPGNNMIWNGADEAAHNGATVDSPGSCSSSKRGLCEPVLQCHGLREESNRNKYGTRSEFWQVIDQLYCAANTGANSSDRYDVGTPQEVEIGMWRLPGNDAEPPSANDCRDNFAALLDGCDTEQNFLNYKAGGRYEKDGWAYTIDPQIERAPYGVNPLVWCSVKDGAANMWGTNWLDVDFGNHLKETFEGANTDSGVPLWGLDKWFFKYEILDGHEWFATIPYADIEDRVINAADVTAQVLTKALGVEGMSLSAQDCLK